MPFGNYVFSVTPYTAINKVATWLGTNRNGVFAPFRVGTADEALAEVASIVNERQEYLLRRLPALSQSRETLSITPGTNSYAIPDDMLDAGIVDIYPTTQQWLGLTIQFMAPAKFRGYGYWTLNSQAATSMPGAWTWDDDHTNIVFAPFLNAMDLAVIYRVNAEEITGESLDDSESDLLFSIPDTYMDDLAMLIAIRIAERLPDSTMQSTCDRLRQRAFGTGTEDAPNGRVAEIQRSLGRPPQLDSSGGLGFRSPGRRNVRFGGCLTPTTFYGG